MHLLDRCVSPVVTQALCIHHDIFWLVGWLSGPGSHYAWNPPLAQDMVCSTEKLFPHAHVDGMFAGVQPYIEGLRYLEKHLCGGQNYALSRVKL